MSEPLSGSFNLETLDRQPLWFSDEAQVEYNALSSDDKIIKQTEVVSDNTYERVNIEMYESREILVPDLIIQCPIKFIIDSEDYDDNIQWFKIKELGDIFLELTKVLMKKDEKANNVLNALAHYKFTSIAEDFGDIDMEELGKVSAQFIFTSILPQMNIYHIIYTRSDLRKLLFNKKGTRTDPISQIGFRELVSKTLLGIESEEEMAEYHADKPLALYILRSFICFYEIIKSISYPPTVIDPIGFPCDEFISSNMDNKL